MENEITFNGTVGIWQMPLTEGEIQGSYSGTFEFRAVLDPIRQLQAGREFRALLGDLSHLASETEYKLALALTQLKHRIIKAPPFWTSAAQDGGIAGNVGDTNIVALVWEAALMAETLYKEKMMAERTGLLDSTIGLAEKKVKDESGN